MVPGFTIGYMECPSAIMMSKTNIFINRVTIKAPIIAFPTLPWEVFSPKSSQLLFYNWLIIPLFFVDKPVYHEQFTGKSKNKKAKILWFCD
jgi:hypothetical protein